MNKTIIKLIIALPLVAIITSSCVIKKYKSPEYKGQIDSLYRTMDNNVDTSVNTAAIHWSAFFTDTILKSYIRRVLSHNLDMLSSRKNIEIAYAQLRSARAAIAPTVGPAQLGFGDGLSLGVSWEIDIWGKLLSGKRASQAALMASREGVQTLQTTLVASVATAYYQLVTLDMQRQIARETILNRGQYLDTIRVMKRAGKVNEVAVQQAVAQLGEVKAALPGIELAIIQTENAISLLMGVPSSGNIKRENSIDIESSRVMNDIGIPAEMLSLRPDVRAAEQKFRNAFELYNVSRAAMYPSLTLSATGNVADLFSGPAGVLNVLAGLTQPIFNGRRLRSQKEIADLQQQQAQLAFQKAILVAGQEVSDALASQLKTKEMSEAKQVQLNAYQKAYQYSFELFVNGYATYLDVLTAQTGVYTTQISLLESFMENLKSRIDLYRALGGGAEYAMEQSEVIALSKALSDDNRAREKAQRKADALARKQQRQR